MKKVVSICLVVSILAVFFFVGTAKSVNEKTIISMQIGNKTAYINGEPFVMDAAPVIVPPGRTVVPIRFISEGFGADVQWEGATKTVTMTMDSIPYLKNQMLFLESNNTGLKSENTKLKSQNADLTTRNTESLEKITTLETKNTDLVSQNSILQQKIDELNSKINENTKEEVISSVADLEYYLKEHYSVLTTAAGKTTFDFEVWHNESTLSPYDYSINVIFDPGFFSMIKTSTTISEATRQKAASQLKDFQEKLAKDIIEHMPNTKLCGGYFYSWYRYPDIEEGYECSRYFSWVNYSESTTRDYNGAKLTTFTWYPLIDDELLP